MSFRPWILSVSLVVIGCGATHPAGDDAGEGCAGYDPSDPCITEENLQQ